MKRLRIIGLALITTVVLGAAIASTALAQPEFSETKTTFSTAAGKTVLKNAFGSITCQKGTGEGEVATVTTIKQVNIKLEECTGKIGEGKCPATITTNALTGELGEVAAAEAKSTVGMLFKPKEGTVIASFKCEGMSISVEGSVASEVEFVSEASEQSNLIFALAEGAQKIKKITTTKEEKPSLKAAGLAATLESTDADKQTSKGIRVFICLPAMNAKYETLFKCKFGPAGGPFTNAWERFFIF